MPPSPSSLSSPSSSPSPPPPSWRCRLTIVAAVAMSPRHRRRHRSDVASLSPLPWRCRLAIVAAVVAMSPHCRRRRRPRLRHRRHVHMGPWQAVVDVACKVSAWACNQRCTVSSVLGGDPWTCMRRGVEVTAMGLRQRRRKVLEGWGSTEMPLAWVGEVGGLKDSGAVAATQLVPVAWQWLAYPRGTPVGACNGSSKTVKRITKEKEKSHLRAAALLRGGLSLRQTLFPSKSFMFNVQLGRTGFPLPHNRRGITPHDNGRWLPASDVTAPVLRGVRNNAAMGRARQHSCGACATTQLRGMRNNAAAGRAQQRSCGACATTQLRGVHDNAAAQRPGMWWYRRRGAAAGGIGGGDGDGGRDSERGDGDGDGDAGSGDADMDSDNRDRVAMVVMRAWARTVGTQTGTTLLLVHILSYE
ncbi:hypothetical protein EDB83DRAFT_2325589 [Lactarius deliciosus]|nr:hypothetical protein EDB83DRAFT_2325589 [Lactarius deliciosus]